MGDVLFGQLFNVVARSRVIGYLERPSESVKAVANSNVERFTKDTVSHKSSD